jgi:hypothetical protein
MIMGIYATLGVFLILAARNPMGHLSLMGSPSGQVLYMAESCLFRLLWTKTSEPTFSAIFQRYFWSQWCCEFWYPRSAKHTHEGANVNSCRSVPAASIPVRPALPLDATIDGKAGIAEVPQDISYTLFFGRSKKVVQYGARIE